MSDSGNTPIDPVQPQQPFASPTGAASEDTVNLGHAGAGAATTVPGGAPRGRRKRNTIIGGVVAGAVLLGAGAAVWAVSALSAGGEQPEAFVPANAIAYADVDFDPSAGQKIDAWQYLRKFPTVKSSSGEGDLKGQIITTLLQDSATSKVDYDKDIKPWMGDRAGVAAIPGASGADPEALVVLQVTDEDKARTELRRLLDLGKDADRESAGVVVRDGYAQIGRTQAQAQALSDAAAEANLADAANYSSDMDAIGERGVASAWIDLAGANKLAADTDGVEDLLGGTGFGVRDLGVGASGEDVDGRFAGALRFDGGTAEVVGRTFGMTEQGSLKAAPLGSLLTDLPTGVTAAAAVGISPQSIADTVAKLTSNPMTAGFVAEAESQTGLKLPGDLQKLLGTGVAVVVDDIDLTMSSAPEVAVRVRTDDAAGSTSVVDRLNARFGSTIGMSLVNAPAEGGVVYALTPAFAAEVAAKGTLGSDARFTAAVPDASDAVAALYLDVDRLKNQIPLGSDADAVAPVTSLGLSTRAIDGQVELRIRVVTR